MDSECEAERCGRSAPLRFVLSAERMLALQNVAHENVPWYRRVHRWGQTNLTEDDPKLCDLEFWKEQWKLTAVQGVIVNCGGIVAYYPSRYGLQYRAGFLGDRDFFKEFSDAARGEGLAVVARMDINRATGEFYSRHPDWFCVGRDGKPIASQGRYFSCVNSGYYKEYIPKVLTEIIEKYRPDGFSDNSWKGLDRNHICYCGNCKKSFYEYCGMDLPQAVDWNDPAYRNWIRWSYRCRTDNWDLFDRTTRQAGGKDCLWLGMLNADPASSCASFVDLKTLCGRSELIFSDHQSRDMFSGFEQNSVNGSLLHLASREDVVVAESMANYVRGRRTFRLAAVPAEETRMWMAEGFAGGISPWFHHVGGGQNDRRRFRTPVPMFRWHEKNDRYLYHRTNLANVGLIWSQTNADFYGRGEVREKVSAPWTGFCHALSKARIPFLPVHADDIPKYAGRLGTIILPDLAVLSGGQMKAVCDFLDRGGNLVMTGITGTLDEDGNPAGKSALWEKLGLSLTDEFVGVSGTGSADWESYEAHNYLNLPKERHEILSGFEDTDLIAFGGGLRRVNSIGGLRAVASYIPAFPIYPPEFSWIRGRSPEIATVFAGRLDSGSRVVYFAADIDRCCGRERLPDHARLLANAVRFAAGDSLPISVQGPGQLDCTVYRQEDRVIVHLVNISGCDRNPGYCDEVYPVGPVRVRLRTKDLNFGRARLLVSETEVPVRDLGGEAEADLPRIGAHEVIVFERAE